MATVFVTFSEDGGCLVDAGLVAPRLGLTPDAMMEQLRAGLVFQTNERGIGADEGRMRLTFRYRHREFQAIVDRTGRLVGPEDSVCA